MEAAWPGRGEHGVPAPQLIAAYAVLVLLPVALGWVLVGPGRRRSRSCMC